VLNGAQFVEALMAEGFCEIKRVKLGAISRPALANPQGAFVQLKVKHCLAEYAQALLAAQQKAEA
jgi:hypothetical protein